MMANGGQKKQFLERFEEFLRFTTDDSKDSEVSMLF